MPINGNDPGRRASLPRNRPPQPLIGAMATAPSEKAESPYSTTTVTAANLRSELQHAYDRLAERDRSDGEMARVRAVLNLPADAEFADVLAEVGRLRMLDRR